MGFISDLKSGISGYGKAIEFIFKNKLAAYFLVPLLLNVFIFSLGLHFVGELTDEAINYSKNQFDLEDWSFWGAEFLKSTVLFLVWLILRILFFFFFIFIGGHLILILLSPLLAYLSEKTEQIITDKDYPFSTKQFVQDILRGIALTVKNFIKEMIAIVLLFFLSFVPILGLATPFLLFLISSYYFGFSFVDYGLERKRFNAKQSSNYANANKGLMIGNGVVFTLCLAIPFIGVGLSAFMAIISTVAATISLLNKQETEVSKKLN